MKRRRSPPLALPICEIVLTSQGNGLSESEVREQLNIFRHCVQAAAPAIAHLRALALQVRIESRGDRLVTVAYLVPKPQLVLPWWLDRVGASKVDPRRLAKVDLEAIRESIRTNQGRLDEVAAAARELGAELHTRLDRGQIALLALLPSHGGKVVDFEFPEGDQLRLAFPGNPLAEDHQSGPVLLRALVYSMHRGFAILASVHREGDGEWTALTGLRDGKLKLTWNSGMRRSSLSAISAGVLSSDPIELCATLFEKGIPPVPVGALLLEEEEVRRVSQEAAVRLAPRNGTSRERAGSNAEVGIR